MQSIFIEKREMEVCVCVCDGDRVGAKFKGPTKARNSSDIITNDDNAMK